MIEKLGSLESYWLIPMILFILWRMVVITKSLVKNIRGIKEANVRRRQMLEKYTAIYGDRAIKEIVGEEFFNKAMRN
ncbi:MAG: hypothetical protein ACOCQR_02840 [bacterium]